MKSHKKQITWRALLLVLHAESIYQKNGFQATHTHKPEAQRGVELHAEESGILRSSYTEKKNGEQDFVTYMEVPFDRLCFPITLFLTDGIL